MFHITKYLINTWIKTINGFDGTILNMAWKISKYEVASKIFKGVLIDE